MCLTCVMCLCLCHVNVSYVICNVMLMCHYVTIMCLRTVVGVSKGFCSTKILFVSVIFNGDHKSDTKIK